MIAFELLEDEAVVVVRPSGPLSRGDFQELTRAVDEFLAHRESLSGLVVQAEHFPGWEDFAGLSQHIRFVRDHHKQIKKVALVTDSHIATVAPILANHFVSADVKHFKFADSEAAMAWVVE